MLHTVSFLRKAMEFLQEFPGMVGLTERLLVLFILNLLFFPFFLIRGETGENGI